MAGVQSGSSGDEIPTYESRTLLRLNPTDPTKRGKTILGDSSSTPSQCIKKSKQTYKPKEWFLISSRFSRKLIRAKAKQRRFSTRIKNIQRPNVSDVVSIS